MAAGTDSGRVSSHSLTFVHCIAVVPLQFTQHCPWIVAARVTCNQLFVWANEATPDGSLIPEQCEQMEMAVCKWLQMRQTDFYSDRIAKYMLGWGKSITLHRDYA